MLTNSVAVGNAAINVGDTYLNDYINDGQINETDIVDVAFSAGVGAYGSEVGLQYSKHSSYFMNTMHQNILSNEMLGYSKDVVKSEIDGVLQDAMYGTGRDMIESSLNYGRSK